MFDSKLPSNKSFGYFFSILFFLVTFFIDNQSIKYCFYFASIVLLLLTTFKPSSLNTPNKIWYNFGYFLNKIISPIILVIIYMVSLAPVAIIFKIINKKSINNTTLWNKHDVETKLKENEIDEKYKYQF